MTETATLRGFTASNISADSSAFQLQAGEYGITVTATWGGGTVALKRLAADGSTYVQVSSHSADEYVTVQVPKGTYKLVVTTATGVYIDISSVIEINGP